MKKSVCNGCKYYSSCGDVDRIEKCEGFEILPDTPEKISTRIRRNAEKIETLENFILSNKDERRKLYESHDIASLKKRHESDDVAEINASEKIYHLQIENAILKDNYRYSVLFYATPVIINACKLYFNKSYGEKTKDKIRDIVRESGYTFYFESGYFDSESTTIKIAKLDANGCCYGNDYITGYITSETPFITKENKLNISDATTIKTHIKYVSDVAGRVKELLKAHREYKKAMEKCDALETVLNNLLPSNYDSYNHATRYIRNLNYVR